MVAAGCKPKDGLLGEVDWTINAVETGPVLEEPEAFTSPPESAQEAEFLDQATGLPLDPERVRAARAEEWQYMEELEVMKEASLDEALAETGHQPIPTRCVDLDKGDKNAPKVRSRLVCQETRRRSTLDVEDWSSVFAATPPYEAFRLQLSAAMTGPKADNPDDDLVLTFFDISRAHLHSPLMRKVYISVEGKVYKLLKAMYGLRDAGASFDRKVTSTLDDSGFKEGSFSPCLATNLHVLADGQKDKGLVRVTRHGDDFAALGRRRANADFEVGLKKHLIVKNQGTLGPRPELGDVQELTHLNRIVRWCSDGVERIELEPDPRHVEILVKQAGLKMDSKGVTTPGVRAPATEDGLPPPSDLLDDESKSLYRSMVMRGAYLAQDRADIQFACKELARRMSAPTQDDWGALKRLVRYLVYRPRVVVCFDRQARQDTIDGYSDADWAGCPNSRKSTSSSYLMVGSHLLASSSTTQTVVATSSGESEFYAAVKTASRVIGGAAMAKDLALVLDPGVMIDASAAKGIASRRGVGKVRHLHVGTLWLQQAVHERRLRLQKQPGQDNVADLGTKHLPPATLEHCIQLAGMRMLSGKSEKGLKMME